jgi:LPXTG-motif cell wall-anchored protein
MEKMAGARRASLLRVVIGLIGTEKAFSTSSNKSGSFQVTAGTQQTKKEMREEKKRAKLFTCVLATKVYLLLPLLQANDLAASHHRFELSLHKYIMVEDNNVEDPPVVGVHEEQEEEVPVVGEEEPQNIHVNTKPDDQIPVLDENAASGGEPVPDLGRVGEGDTSNTVATYIGGIVLLLVAVVVLLRRRKTSKEGSSRGSPSAANKSDIPGSNSISLEDISYLVKHLHADSSHMDVLLVIASTPETIQFGLAAYNEAQAVIEERRKEEREEKSGKDASSSKENLAFDLDDAGWADEEDEDDEEAKEKAKLAKAADEEKEKNRQALEQATGKVRLKLEGFDEGVIGQKWVEDTLASKGFWPPQNMKILEGRMFEYKGEQVSALDHPGLRRNLCMIMGRLHATMLNSHPDLCKSSYVSWLLLSSLNGYFYLWDVKCT